MSNSTVTVEYKTQKRYCPWCHQKLEKAEISNAKKTEFSKETALSWAPWKEIVKHPEDMDDLILEYVHETISFFATDLYEKIIIENSEIERVKVWILNEVV